MPLLKGKENIGHNVEEMEKSGHTKAQSVAAALRTAGVPKKGDRAPPNARATGDTHMASAPSSGMPMGRSANDRWPGRSV